MTSERTAMLFCPPLPPLRLRAGQTVSIGRHSSCEFPLREEEVSRRHCEVIHADGRFALRDLGSTNGSFVNGQRVEGDRVLATGDKIEIGSSVVTFCELEGDIGPDEDEAAQTVVAHRAAEDAFQGSLEEIPTFALLQVLEMGSKSGVLEIAWNDGHGRIWFASGMPVHAETPKLAGFDAALAMVQAAEGRFRFSAQLVTTERTIQASVTELLLEATRLLDEEGA
jgi:hypothetical protein